jgi:hypothetical protein
MSEQSCEKKKKKKSSKKSPLPTNYNHIDPLQESRNKHQNISPFSIQVLKKHLIDSTA